MSDEQRPEIESAEAFGPDAVREHILMVKSRPLEAMRYAKNWSAAERYAFLKWCKAEITIYSDAIIVNGMKASNDDWILNIDGVFVVCPNDRFHRLCGVLTAEEIGELAAVRRDERRKVPKEGEE